jgi:hypothetical protein
MHRNDGALTVAAEADRRAADSPPNIRAILRAGNAFFLRSLSNLAASHPDNLISALIFCTIATSNVRHVTNSPANLQHGGIDNVPPDHMRRPVSVLALSAALGMPYETVRRYVGTLIARGLCVRIEGRGVVVPTAILNTVPGPQAIATGYCDLLRLLADLKRASFDFTPYRRHAQTVPTPPAGEIPANARALLRVGMEAILRGVDVVARLNGGDFLQGLVYTAIWTANVEHITGGPKSLSFGGLAELPPDAMRRPVTVSALATVLRMPYETVRRHAGKLIDEGRVLRLDGGLIVPRAVLESPAQFEAVSRSHRDINRLVADLHRAGFDFSLYWSSAGAPVPPA